MWQNFKFHKGIMTKSITIEDLRNHKKKKTKFACLTAYDASLSQAHVRSWSRVNFSW